MNESDVLQWAINRSPDQPKAVRRTYKVQRTFTLYRDIDLLVDVELDMATLPDDYDMLARMGDPDGAINEYWEDEAIAKADAMPPPEPDADHESTDIVSCTVHFDDGTSETTRY